MVLWLTVSPAVSQRTILVEMHQSWAFFVSFSTTGGWTGAILKKTKVLEKFKFLSYRDVTFWRLPRYHFLSFRQVKASQKYAKILHFFRIFSPPGRCDGVILKKGSAA